MKKAPFLDKTTKSKYRSAVIYGHLMAVSSYLQFPGAIILFLDEFFLNRLQRRNPICYYLMASKSDILR